MSVQSFLKHPSQQFEFRESKIKIFIISLLTCYFLVFLTSVFLASLKNLIFNSSIENRIFDSPLLNSYSGTLTFFFLVLVFAPFLEELIFRLPMNGKRWSISLSAGIFIHLIIQPPLSNISFVDWPRILIGIFSGIATYLIISFYLFKHLNKLFRNYSKNYLIYFLTILFALFHIANFNDFQWKYIVLYPILVLPQFLIGSYLAFIRINFGFWYSLLFHAFINIPASLAIFSKLA